LFIIGGFDGTRCYGDTNILDLEIYAHVEIY